MRDWVRTQTRLYQQSCWLLVRFLILLFVLLLAFGMALPAIAQEGRPDDSDDRVMEPSRGVERRAPRRQPVVLQTEVLTHGATNTVVELSAEADAYIASEWPDDNFGSDALYLGYNLPDGVDFGAERLLLRFDVLSTVPIDAVINMAHLRLRLNWSDPVDDDPMGTVLRRTASDWDESTVTWNSEPTWGEIRASADVGSASAWYEWEITDLVADWTDGTHDDYGVEIIGDERVQQRERIFYSRETGSGLYPRLVVGYTDFDDHEPPIVTVDPLPTYVRRGFTVSWSGTDPGGSGIEVYEVQFRVDGGDWADWLVDVTFTSADFVAGQDDRFYEFRARGKDRAGNVEPFGGPEAGATVDAEPPTSLVAPLPPITRTDTFRLSWTGHDDGSGIQYFDVQYRVNRSNWILWQQKTIATSAEFTAIEDGLFEFEARAVDNLGLSESFANQAEASVVIDAREPFIVPRSWLPIVVRQ